MYSCPQQNIERLKIYNFKWKKRKVVTSIHLAPARQEAHCDLGAVLGPEQAPVGTGRCSLRNLTAKISHCTIHIGIPGMWTDKTMCEYGHPYTYILLCLEKRQRPAKYKLQKSTPDWTVRKHALGQTVPDLINRLPMHSSKRQHKMAKESIWMLWAGLCSPMGWGLCRNQRTHSDQ